MKLLAIFTTIIAPSLVWANTLLIISSGDGMYGDDKKMNIAIESFGANFVEYKLKPQYRKVYQFIDSKKDQELETLLTEITKERVGQERLDVITMQHGPDGLPFNSLSMETVQKIIPYAFLRNVYSTSCSEFGEFKARDNNSLEIVHQNGEFSKNLQMLGIETYIYHANDNATGVFTLPLLTQNILKFKDWKKAAEETSRQYDESSAKLIPTLASLSESNVLQNLFPSVFSDDMDWEQLFNSRMVIAQKKSHSSIKSMMKIDVNDFEENMPAMTPSLSKIISENCPTGLAPIMTCSQTKPLPLHQSFKIILDELAGLFRTYSPDNSCLPGEILQPFLEQYGLSDFIFKKLCLLKKSEDRFELQWKLSTQDFFKMRLALEFSDMSELKKITIAKQGKISVRLNKEETVLTVNGIKVFVNGFDGEGKSKWLSRFKFKGIKISDSGNVKGRIRFLIFPIVAGVNKKSFEEIDSPDFVKLFGLTVWKAKED